MSVISRVKIENAATFVGPSLNKFHFKSKENHPDCLKIKDSMMNIIRVLYRETGVYQYICSIMPGVEMWAAETLLKSKKEYHDIELYCICPQISQINKWSKANRKRFDYISHNCTALLTLSRGNRPSGSTGYISDKFFSIEHTGILIAVSEMEENRVSIPTWAIKKARDNGKRIVFIR